MKQNKHCEQRMTKENKQNADAIEQMLISAYSEESVPHDVKIRLQNRLACQKAMETGRVSFWWLPATIATTVSIVSAVFLCLTYLIVNINGANTWMPNFLQFVSEIWLKIHLIALLFEVTVSWFITFLSVWKGNLVKSARIF